MELLAKHHLVSLGYSGFLGPWAAAPAVDSCLPSPNTQFLGPKHKSNLTILAPLVIPNKLSDM